MSQHYLYQFGFSPYFTSFVVEELHLRPFFFLKSDEICGLFNVRHS